MEISEKIYRLRKQSGLSQEELAEKLNVSRQAISKWELGTSVPESEKLIAISDFFGVSLDELIKGEVGVNDQNSTAKNCNRQLSIRFILGITLSIVGIVCLIVWGILTLANPSATEHVGASSTVTLDGKAILLILCVVAVIVGAILLLKSKKG